MDVKKKISVWLQEIVDVDVKDKAIKYFKAEKTADIICYSLSEAISNAFYWNDTKEGHAYWMEIVNDLGE